MRRQGNYHENSIIDGSFNKDNNGYGKAY